MSEATGTTGIADSWQAGNNKVYIGSTTHTYPDAGIALVKVGNKEWSALQVWDAFDGEKHLFGW